MNILICPDKFKGTLKAGEAAQAIAAGWRKGRAADSIELLPISDGGDGFGELLSIPLQAHAARCRTVDAAGRPCWSTWWCVDDGHLAIVESARTIGLAMLPPGDYHPFQLDTRGLGEVLMAAKKAGSKKCVLGIGGSATNDGGFGVARACGWEFLDRHGRAIEAWTELSRLRRLKRPATRAWPSKIVVAVDVKNPLLGKSGATRVYGPQKGLQPEDFRTAERCLRRLTEVTAEQLGRDFSVAPGAGAAGGLGFGLMAFFGARVQGGFDLFARYTGLKNRLRGADLAITGEGSVDRSTLMGKGVGLLAKACRDIGKPCLAIGGVVAPEVAQGPTFTLTASLVDLAPDPEDARRRSAFWVRRAGLHLAREFEARA